MLSKRKHVSGFSFGKSAHSGDVVGVRIVAEDRLRVVGVDVKQADMRVASCGQQTFVCCNLELVDLRTLASFKKSSRPETVLGLGEW